MVDGLEDNEVGVCKADGNESGFWMIQETVTKRCPNLPGIICCEAWEDERRLRLCDGLNL